MEIIDEKIDLTDDLAKDRKVVRGDIAFDHVYFKYKKDAKYAFGYILQGEKRSDCWNCRSDWLSQIDVDSVDSPSLRRDTGKRLY